MPTLQSLSKNDNYEKLLDLNFETSLSLVDRSKLFV